MTEQEALDYIKSHREPGIGEMGLGEQLLKSATNTLGVGIDPAAEQAAREEGKKPGSFWENLGVGGYSALNTAGLGLPDFILSKVLPSETYQRFQETRARNAVANRIGSLAGFAGSLAIPAGAESKALGSLVGKIPGLGKAGEAIRAGGQIAAGSRAIQGPAGRILTPLVRGAVVTGEQAVPRFLAQGGTTGDWAQAAKNLGINMALGTGVGALGSLIGKKVPGALDETKDYLNRLQLSTEHGINTSAMRRGLRGSASAIGIQPRSRSGFAISQTPGRVEDLGTLFKKYSGGVGGKKGNENVLQAVSDGFNAHARLYQDSGIKLGDHLETIMNSDEMKQAMLQYGRKPVEDAVYSFAQLADGSTWTEGRIQLGKIMAAANRTGGIDQMAAADVAAYLKNYMDAQANQLANAARAGGAVIPDLDELKALYGADRTIQLALERQVTQMPTGAVSESPTASRLGIMNLISPGSVAGGGAAGFGYKPDPDDPLGGIKKIGAILAGSVAGGLLNKAGTGLANQAIGKTSGFLNRIIPSGESAVGQAISKGIATLPAKAIGAGEITNLAEGKTISGIDISGAQEPPSLTGKEPPQTPQEMQASLAAGTAEGGMDPQAIQDTQNQINVKYIDQIRNKLKGDWDTMFAPIAAQAGITYEQFIDLVAQMTNNFDPKHSAKILFKTADERKKYLNDYNTALQLQNINIGQAISYGGFGQGLENMIPGLFPKEAEEKKAYDDLADLLLRIPNPPNTPSRNIKEVKQDLENIRRMAVPQEQKTAMVNNLIQTKYGIDLAGLENLGLYGA